MSVQAKAERLRAAVKLLAEASEVIINEWEKEEKNPISNPSDGSPLRSHELYDASRTMLGAMGVCGELVQEPRARLIELSLQYYESRALHIAAEARVADILQEGDHKEGVSIDELSRRTGVKAHKLG